MAASHDRANGIALMIVSTLVFTFYTFWVIILPFVDTDHPLHGYFPDRKVGLLIPFLIGVFILTITTSFIGIVMIRH